MQVFHVISFHDFFFVAQCSCPVIFKIILNDSLVGAGTFTRDLI